MGRAHRAALSARGQDHGRPGFTRAMAAAFAGSGADDAHLAAALVLVADYREAGVVGTVVAYPPPNVATRFGCTPNGHRMLVIVRHQRRGQPVF